MEICFVPIFEALYVILCHVCYMLRVKEQCHESNSQIIHKLYRIQTFAHILNISEESFASSKSRLGCYEVCVIYLETLENNRINEFISGLHFCSLSNLVPK